MKPNNNEGAESPTSDAPLHEEEEITINARLLFPYLRYPNVSYEDWAASLQAMVAQPSNPMKFRLLTGADGELALNSEFAMHLPHQALEGLMGAIALDLIAEGDYVAARGGHLNYTNELLNAFGALAADQNHMPSDRFCEILPVEKDYRPEIYPWKKQYTLEYRSDSVCITFRGNGVLEYQLKNAGKGTVKMGPSYSMTVGPVSTTGCGDIVQKFLETYRCHPSSIE